MSQKILHISDSHINDRQYDNSSKTPLGGLSLAVDLAIDNDIDCIVHSGNIFHYQTVNSKTIDAVRDQLQRLSTKGIDFFCIRGDKELKRTGNEVSNLIGEQYVQQLDSNARIINDIALFGTDNVKTKKDIQLKLDSLSSTSQPTQNIVVAHQRLSPPCKHELADISAKEFYNSISLNLNIVLAGGQYESCIWEDNESNFFVIYSGSTNPLVIAPGATITGTVIQVDLKGCEIKSVNLRNSN